MFLEGLNTLGIVLIILALIIVIIVATSFKIVTQASASLSPYPWVILASELCSFK